MSSYEFQAEQVIQPFHDLTACPGFREPSEQEQLLAALTLQLAVDESLDGAGVELNNNPLGKAMRAKVFTDRSMLTELVIRAYDVEDEDAKLYERYLISCGPAEGLLRCYGVKLCHSGPPDSVEKYVLYRAWSRAAVL